MHQTLNSSNDRDSPIDHKQTPIPRHHFMECRKTRNPSIAVLNHGLLLNAKLWFRRPLSLRPQTSFECLPLAVHTITGTAKDESLVDQVAAYCLYTVGEEAILHPNFHV